MKNYIRITEDLEKALKQKEKVSNQLPVQQEYAIVYLLYQILRLWGNRKVYRIDIP